MPRLTLLVLAIVFSTGLTQLFCTDAQAAARKPAAPRKPHRLEIHGHVRLDPYYWLRERENSKVVDYLEAENAYTDAVMKDFKPLEDKLFAETKGRIKEDDSSVPYREDGFWYYTRYEEGKDYPLYCRSRSRDQSDERVMLDVNLLAAGHKFCSIRGVRVSSGGDLLAFAVDFVGRRFYTVRFKDLNSSRLPTDEIPDVTGNLAWANDNQTLFYARQHPQTLRSYQIYRHRLGTEVANDQLVYEEQDETFRCSVLKTRSKRFLMIAS